MWRLLELFVILGFIGVCVFSIYKIISGALKQQNKPDFELDTIIKDLKEKIAIEELKSQSGIENAEAKLTEYKDRLKKAESYKLKTQNL